MSIQKMDYKSTIPPIDKVGKNVTFKEMTGGNVQTTTLRVKLNGNFIGKFNNVTRSMAKNDEQNAKSTLKFMKDNKYVVGEKEKPHAEDYMITYFHKNWKDVEKYIVKGESNILSIAMDKSPCIVCAQNLVDFAKRAGVLLRIKAGFHYEMTKKRGVPEGTFGAKHLEDNNIPIRSWPMKKMQQALDAADEKIKPAMTERFKISLGAFSLNNNVKPIDLKNGSFDADIGWRSVGFSRKFFKDGTFGRGWGSK